MANVATSLRALADKKTEGVSKDNMFNVDPRIIQVEQGFNTRFWTPARRAYVDGMKRAQKAGAKFPPLKVRVDEGVPFIVDGHNRLQMYLELIEEGAPILSVQCLEFKGSDADRTAYMLSTGQQGLKLSQLESGHGFRRLVNWGWNITRIADHSGVSDTYVEQAITLAESDMAIQQMIVREEVACHLVVDVLRKHGKKALQVLQETLSKAKATGSKKVTSKALYGPAIPRPVISKVVSSLDTFYTRLSDDDRENLETLLNGNEAELEGKTVTLSASSLKALFDARQEVQQVYAKAASRDEKKRARALAQTQERPHVDTLNGSASEADDEFSVDDVVAQHISQAA
ncbi:hypothetical protein [Paraburkholderia hospita]|uniref:hypothetical protein n=1 Tax=Paraburkholderia hospita TaxID=169430 RepID=UPI0008A79AE0|nr:hypothetical protein [Paraburkholderia hospita]SEI14617.1 hypothetical protein SAMN05192544_102576 [Paraburkholderia hospita]